MAAVTARIIDTFGTDEKISRMARISYGVETPLYDKELKSFLFRLLRDGHFVPFEHCAITYFIECPIYVSRQIVRYRTAVVSEKSLRYTRVRELDDKTLPEEIRREYSNIYSAYDNLIRGGTSFETARAILPLGTPTMLYYTINLRNLLHFFEQRISEHAQPETRQLAEMMLMVAKGAFPATFVAWQALKEGKTL